MDCNDRNVNRAARGLAEAVTDDRDYRGRNGRRGRKACRDRKVAARRAARRLNKAVLAAERE